MSPHSQVSHFWDSDSHVPRDACVSLPHLHHAGVTCSVSGPAGRELRGAGIEAVTFPTVEKRRDGWMHGRTDCGRRDGWTEESKL